VSNRAPFDATLCALVEALRPEVVSFHFGLPDAALLVRVRATGAKILSSATTVAEARWLEAQGVDAVIAQGAEAGGHRGMFLTGDVATQIGTLSLVPQIVDALRCPVIAAGGIADGRGIAAAFMLGASAVQIGTAYLFCPEATISQAHRQALAGGSARETALTTVFTGRPARSVVNRAMRELGYLAPDAPAFPLAAGAMAPLRAATEPQGSGDFMPLWSGQSAGLGQTMTAQALTEKLAQEAASLLVR
jgi:nitronate monooxygenase